MLKQKNKKTVWKNSVAFYVDNYKDYENPYDYVGRLIYNVYISMKYHQRYN